MDCSPRLSCPWDFPGKNTGVSCHFLLQGNFVNQESNLHQICIGRQILDHRAIRKPTLNNELFSSVQSLSCVQLFMTPWTIACQTSQSITNFWSLLKLMSIQSVMSSNQFTLCHPLFLPPSILPSIMVFPMSQFFASGGQSIGVSASASVLPMNIQDWFPLGLTGWMSLQSKGLSRVLFNTTVQKHQFLGAQLSLWSNSHICTWPLEKP